MGIPRPKTTSSGLIEGGSSTTAGLEPEDGWFGMLVAVWYEDDNV